MADRPKDAQPADDPGGDDSGNDESSGGGGYKGGGSIHDPLTRRDVKAPRVPFETDPSADG